MRHLYAISSEPGVSYLIEKAKTYERRRCGHRPEDFPEPLSEKECLASVVDPKGNKTNKNCYVVASQELEVRKHMRSVMGVPLVYISRSVIKMEPMAGATSDNRDREERVKFRAGLKRGSGSMKRKRDDDEGDKGEDGENMTKKKKKRTGVKEPNPLAVKKSKKKKTKEDGDEKKGATEGSNPEQLEASESSGKRKRKRRPKAGAGENAEANVVEAGEAVEE